MIFSKQNLFIKEMQNCQFSVFLATSNCPTKMCDEEQLGITTLLYMLIIFSYTV